MWYAGNMSNTLEILTTDRKDTNVLRKICFIKKYAFLRELLMHQKCIIGGCIISRWMTVTSNKSYKTEQKILLIQGKRARDDVKDSWHVDLDYALGGFLSQKLWSSHLHNWHNFAKNLGSGKSGSLAIRRTAWSAQKISHPLFVDQLVTSTHRLVSSPLENSSARWLQCKSTAWVHEDSWPCNGFFFAGRTPSSKQLPWFLNL